jgi:hypothetical protein
LGDDRFSINPSWLAKTAAAAAVPFGGHCKTARSAADPDVHYASSRA